MTNLVGGVWGRVEGVSIYTFHVSMHGMLVDGSPSLYLHQAAAQSLVIRQGI